jgi:hypothetical protein
MNFMLWQKLGNQFVKYHLPLYSNFSCLIFNKCNYEKKNFSCILLVGIFGGTALNLRLNSQNELSSNLTLDQLSAFSCENISGESNGNGVLVTVVCGKSTSIEGQATHNYCTASGYICSYTSNGSGW